MTLTRSISKAARIAAAALAILAAGAAGCRSGTDTGIPPVDLRGQWRYSGEQLAPTRAGLNGTLSIEHQGGLQLDGRLTVTESSAGGLRALSGFVNGRIPDIATAGYTLSSSAATATLDLPVAYKVLLDWGSDTPGQYSLDVVYTVTAP